MKPHHSAGVGLASITALFAALLLVWSAVNPTYRAPDENLHVDTILQLEQHGSYPPPGSARISEEMLASQPLTGQVRDLDGAFRGILAPLPLRTDDAPDDEAELPFRSLGVEGELPPDVPPNQMTQHPPLYYLIGAGLLRIVPTQDGWAFTHTVGLLRLLSILLLLPIPALAFGTARRLGAEPPVALSAAALPLALPQLTHVGASVNNDALLVLAGAVVAFLVARVTTGDLSRRTAVLAGAALAVGGLTKAFGLVLLPAAALGYAVAWWTARRQVPERARTALRSGALALAIGGLGCGWWYTLNLVRYGTPQPDGSPPFAGVGGVTFAEWLGRFASRTAMSTVGWFGFFDGRARMPVLLVAAVLVVLVGGALLALRPRDRRPAVAALLGMVGLMVAVVVQQSFKSWNRHEYVAGTQGRYLFSVLVAVVGPAAVGLRTLVTGPRVRWLPLAIVGVAVGIQVAGIGVAIDAFHRGPDGRWLDATSSLLAWTLWPRPFVSFAVIALAVAAAMAVLALRPAPPSAPDRHDPVVAGEPAPAAGR